MGRGAQRIGDIFAELRHAPGAALTVLILPTGVFVIHDLTRIGGSTLSANFFLASLIVLSVVGAALNQMARGLADDLPGHWGERQDLPAGSLKSLIAARAAGTVVLAGIAMAPLLVVAFLISPVGLAVGTWLLLIVSIILGAVPIMLYGIVIALWFRDSARPIATVSYFVLALGGGLILPPQSIPFAIWWVAAVLPSRHYGDVVWAPVLGWDLATGNWLWLVGFTALFGAAVAVHLRRENFQPV